MQNKALVTPIYVNYILNQLDYEAQRKWLYDILSEEYDRYTDEELEVEIKARYGDSWFSENLPKVENQEN
jgi:hypothetical protein